MSTDTAPSSEVAPPSSRVGSAVDASRDGTARRAGAGVCVFTVDDKKFAVETTLVGEVTTVENILPVPMAPPAVLGLFSLRGTPLAVVDLLSVLGEELGPVDLSRSQTLLVLRPQAAPLAALRIDRLDAVVPAGRGKTQPFDSEGAHPTFAGLFEYGAQPAVMLASKPLLETLLRLSFSTVNNPKERP